MRSPSPAPVLFVESYPQSVYGQQQTLLALLDLCDPARVAPAVAAPFEGPALELVRARGVPVEILAYPPLMMPYGGTIYGYGALRRLRLGGQAAGYISRLRRYLRRRDIAAVYCNDMRGILTVGVAARSLGVPVMTWDKLDRPHGRLDMLQLPLVRRNVCISESVKAKYPPRQVRRYRDRLVTVMNGIDIARFDAGRSIRAMLGLNADDVAYGIVGTVCERKAQDRLLAVAPALSEAVSNARILVVGTPETETERSFAAALPNRDHPCVAFLGRREDMPDVMHSLDVLVIPSRHEGMGRVTVEAMACRLPVAGARTGGIPEVVVDGETGLLFDGNDPAALLAALVRLGCSAELRRQLGEAGRARAERHFDVWVQTGKVLEILYEMLDERRQ